MPEPVTLTMDEQEAHDLHHALATVVDLIDQVGDIPSSAPLYGARPRLVVLARRLDHERRHKGAVPNPNVNAHLLDRVTDAIVEAHAEEMRAFLRGEVEANAWRPESYARAALAAIADPQAPNAETRQPHNEATA